jgi:preprotein translocase subunit Sec63
MVSLEPLATLLTWQFAPSFLASRALDLIYKLRPSARPRNQEQAIFYARITHIILLAFYFIFSVVSSYRKLWAAPNYYQLLGFRSADSVHPSAEAWESALKSSWRKLTLRFHPDKLGDSATPELEAYFVAVRAGYEALSDPVRKVAYERFGPATLQSCQAGLQKCVTLRDYSVRGLQSSCGFYAFSLGTLLVLFMLQRITFGQYVRL